MCYRQFVKPLGLFACVLALSGCGGGGGGSDSNGGSPGSGGAPPPQSGTPGSTAPVFAGFDFSLQQGDFWEYRWDYLFNGQAQGSSPTTTTDTGRFWLVLGAPRDIGGVTAYTVERYGQSQVRGDLYSFFPNWEYLALADNKLLGSTDGVTLKTIFDAQQSSWAGGGFFRSIGDTNLVVVTQGTLSNDYITTPAIVARLSLDNNQCQYFPGIGSICGDSSQHLTQDEYFSGGVGVVGLHYQNSYSSCGGGFCSGGSWDNNVGMTASSRNGASLPFLDESTTLHNGPTNAQTLSIPTVVRGDVHSADGGYSTSVVVNGATVTAVIEDWYKVTVAAPRSVKVTLSFEDSTTADLDLYVFAYNSRGPSQVAYSAIDNVATISANETYFNETVTYTLNPTLLNAGTYYIAVDSWTSPNGRVPYVLQIE